jgi:glycosyltransferase involved in cell wall biosynthesis
MPRVLVVAFHFPPQAGSSGIQRALRLVQDLPGLGWDPVVLTAHPRAYESRTDDLLSDVPADVPVFRAPAWDASRHFALAQRYPDFLARPDRWVSWWPGGVIAGLRAVRRYRPAALWTTYPIATAHLIGGSLAKRTRLPWIADFRDPLYQASYPADPRVRQRNRRIEAATVARARFSTFTTPSALREYQARYPGARDRMVLVANGYDEGSFRDAQPAGALNPGRLTLLHSGVVYASERDPTCLMQALARLRAERPGAYEQMRVRFRGPADGGLVLQLARGYGVEDAVECLPPLGYREALGEMLGADGLLILQAANCNAQIPAKYYEYIRAGRPVLGLTDPAGDTGQALRQAGLDTIAPLDDPDAIAGLLCRFALDAAQLPRPDPAYVAEASRASRARLVANLLAAG